MSPALKKILLAGFIVGTLDITAACVQYWVTTDKNPLNVLPMVAGGAFGKNAFNGSIEMKMYGLLFHFIIAFSFTALFYFIYRRYEILRGHKLLTGVGYGIFMWAVTNLIIIPLSAIGWRPFVLSKAAVAAAILIFCIGIPLTFLFRGTHDREVVTQG
jgi:hypothetical protein